jgi:hypothetical protein
MRLVGRVQLSQAAARLRLPPLAWFLLLALTILAGYTVTRLQSPWVYLLPPLHALTVLLTAVWFFAAGSRGLQLGSNQRFWGVLASGLVLGPLLILVVEIFFLIGLGILAIVSLAMNQPLLEQLLPLLEQTQISPEATDALFNLLRPYLASPVVLYITLAFGAGLVPLIEELFKPIGVWLLYDRPLTPAQGFTLGMLSGAGYAIFESLSLTLSGENWAPLMISRGGTTLLHIFTAGLVGWGLAGAFQRKEYLKLVLVYLAAVLLHGLWNAISLISSSGVLLVDELPAASLIIKIGEIAPYGLVGLTLFLFILLLGANRYFARREPIHTSTPAPLPASAAGSVFPMLSTESPPSAEDSKPEYNEALNPTSTDNLGENPTLRDTDGVDQPTD